MKTLVLARSYIQYHGFTCGNPNAFIHITDPEQMKGFPKGTNILKLEGCHNFKKPEDIEMYEIQIRIYNFVVFSEATFKEIKL